MKSTSTIIVSDRIEKIGSKKHPKYLSLTLYWHKDIGLKTAK